MKIYITGCARSGTTLMRRLFYAFENVSIIDKEKNIFHFSCIDEKNETLIGKRSVNSIFSGEAAKDEYKSIECINQYDIKILNMLRDGRDVLISKQVTFDRWIRCIEQRENHKDLISLEIRYENLVTKPDQIQAIIAKAFGLFPKYLFSKYPIFFPENTIEVKSRSKQLLAHKRWGYRNIRRPIDTQSIRRLSDTYKKFIRDKDKDKFEQYNRSLGYLD